MPSHSIAQQRFMGMVHAVQKGKLKAPSKAVADAAKSISKTDARHFAETKHDGLPEHVKKALSELQLGKQEESEHKVSKKIQNQLVKEHLDENPTYYSTLRSCMKTATCATTDKNIPASFDSKQAPIEIKAKAFAKGFKDQAKQAGLNEKQSNEFLFSFIKHANIDSIFNPGPGENVISEFVNHLKGNNEALNQATLMSVLGGGALSGLAGYGLTEKSEDPHKDHRMRNGLLAALGGAGLAGFGGRQIYGGLQSQHDMNTFLHNIGEATKQFGLPNTSGAAVPGRTFSIGLGKN